ncbi:hypothetical protein WKH56_19785 [Priestia sp. SB1]|uniref:hypothetical protein n=1 Tax=Priestia sp. SB1 TaxID=3132359 RepID=UPI00317FE053
MNQIVKNVEYIIEKYGDKISSDKHLLLSYWKLVDKVEMNKENFNTASFIQKASSPEAILNAKRLLEVIEKE